MIELNKMLDQLKVYALSPNISKEQVLSILGQILEWLNDPINNTDDNCKKIDYFVAYEIAPNKGFELIPDDIKEILFDMGVSLSDTHTAPDVAENFESTPEQLLKRVRKLMENIKE
jgi:hypothetical protein